MDGSVSPGSSGEGWAAGALWPWTYRWETGLELHVLTVVTFPYPQSTLQCALLPVQAWQRPCAFFTVCILPPAFIPIPLSTQEQLSPCWHPEMPGETRLLSTLGPRAHWLRPGTGG